MEKRKQEMQEAENEEEVKLRQDEFKQHPLFSKLKLYAEELKDYIEEKRKVQQQRLLELQKEQEKKESHSLYPDIKGGNIFCTQKIINNNSNLRTPTVVQPPVIPPKPIVKVEVIDEKLLDKEESKDDMIDENDESKKKKA